MSAFFVFVNKVDERLVKIFDEFFATFSNGEKRNEWKNSKKKVMKNYFDRNLMF